MGMDLLGTNENVSLTLTGWVYVLEAAQRHGWTPTDGVLYWSNDFDTVTAEDANTIADALELAIQIELLPQLRNMPIDSDRSKGVACADSACESTRREALARLHLVRRIVTLCRGGAFKIG